MWKSSEGRHGARTQRTVTQDKTLSAEVKSIKKQSGYCKHERAVNDYRAMKRVSRLKSN